jgi:hypothetical protein
MSNVYSCCFLLSYSTWHEKNSLSNKGTQNRLSNTHKNTIRTLGPLRIKATFTSQLQSLGREYMSKNQEEMNSKQATWLAGLCV